MTYLNEEQYRLQKASHTDAEGLISQDKNPGRWTSGNGALDSALDRVLLFMNGWLKDSDCREFETTISNLWAEGRAGLLSRNRGRPDQDAWDNYIGACVGSFFCDVLSVPRAIRAYGDSHFYTFQNEPGFDNMIKATFFRFPGFLAIVKIACMDGDPPSGLDLSCLGYRLTDKPDSPTEAKTKLLMALCVLYYYAPIPEFESIRSAALLQIRMIRSKYGSLEGMLSAYYGDRNPFAGVRFPLPQWFTKDPSCPV